MCVYIHVEIAGPSPISSYLSDFFFFLIVDMNEFFINPLGPKIKPMVKPLAELNTLLVYRERLLLS